ncbi:hypothetical protein G3435_17140, partial [Pseudomonas sp. MAFF212428]|nr:hypothetical protein [Pseudomonas brassicae]
MSASRPRNRKPYNSLALALEPRMMFDAAAVTTAVQTAEHTDAQQAEPVNVAPTVSAQADKNAAHTVTAGDSNGVALFSNAKADSGDGNQGFDSLFVTVNSISSHEALIVDGTRITLNAGDGTTTGGYKYITTTSGGVSTLEIILSASANDAASLQTLIDGIRYTTLDNSVDSGSRTISLVQIRDEGGTDGGGKDSTTLAISAEVTLTNTLNRAPVLGNDGLVDLAQSLSANGLGTLT